MKALDLLEKRFGKLVAVGPTDERINANILWLCQCDCGNTTKSTATNLRQGLSRSCGCARAETNKRAQFRDLSGMTIGQLSVVSFAGYFKKNGARRGAHWNCICSCGKESVISSGSLLSGNTKSCGCKKGWPKTHGLTKTKEYGRASAAKYRKRKTAATAATFSPHELVAHIERIGKQCIHCGGNYEHNDHYIPISRGGRNSLDNIVPSCAKCNLSKGGKFVGAEWVPPLVREFT